MGAPKEAANPTEAPILMRSRRSASIEKCARLVVVKVQRDWAHRDKEEDAVMLVGTGQQHDDWHVGLHLLLVLLDDDGDVLVAVLAVVLAVVLVVVLLVVAESNLDKTDEDLVKDAPTMAPI